ncbi:unnamed protein product [Angiostrongylus costaricensis]|uniref:Protein kinase domain-containing protein n=1 Tax=Angiostrongylus costaricensis TaxID=334426 RepID=A0A0R3PX67_ANGCS|nr:unnamed protein product [Angiostrongylus costaricensis]
MGYFLFHFYIWSDSGPVQIPKGEIISKRWRIIKKLGEGGCGAVYKVENIHTKQEAALKAESNFVSGGSVLKLEVQILQRLLNRPYVAQLLHSGKRETYCYVVMTLLGESLRHITKLVKIAVVSSQVRIGINILFGLKQIHDIGFIHRDIKPANMAVGKFGTPEYRFIHILDFGLAREFVVMSSGGKLKMRRPRARALFRGTTRYCSIGTHEKSEQGRMDDLWCLLYMLAELRGPLPWTNRRCGCISYCTSPSKRIDEWLRSDQLRGPSKNFYSFRLSATTTSFEWFRCGFVCCLRIHHLQSLMRW